MPADLDELAREPMSVRRLTIAEAEELTVRCASVLGILREYCSQRLLPMAEDRAIDAAEVAELIGMSKSWVEHNTEQLPARRSIAGTPRWLLSDVESWLKNRARYGHTS